MTPEDNLKNIESIIEYVAIDVCKLDIRTINECSAALFLKSSFEESKTQIANHEVATSNIRHYLQTEGDEKISKLFATNSHVPKDGLKLFCLAVASVFFARRDFDNGLSIDTCDFTTISFSIGIASQKMMATLPIDREAMLLAFKSQIGKHAVSKRPDQLIKSEWLKHVIKCSKSGIEIKNIESLLKADGCPSDAKKISKETLKAWSKEANPKIKFKAGRPKK